MKRYTAAAARQSFSDVLDKAEEGQPVTIERRGVQFTLIRSALKKQPVSKKRLVAWVDPQVLTGQWRWQWQDGCLEFLPGSKHNGKSTA